MNMRDRLLSITMGAAVTLAAFPAFGQSLYMQNFDVDDTPNWTINDGPTDEHADFFFDYGTVVGIPSAPNSGGTTRGMKLQANITDGIFGGFSVSPNGQMFTGDYKLTFDWWHNYIGGDTEIQPPGGVGFIGTTPGSTMLSLFGIETSGTVANRAGVSDSIFFAATGDTSSSAFRVYSAERPVSYQLPIPMDPPLDEMGQPIDSHATYHAGTRSNNPATGGGMEVYYQNAFPSVTVPAAQTALFPETQHGMTQSGTTGFAWHEVEITRSGEMVTWIVDGTLLITLDTTNFVGETGGTNILFGHGDINAGISSDPYYDDVAFTLIDNVEVEQFVEPPAEDADFDADGDVDGADFLKWQQELGRTGTATLADGDANGDMNVTAADLAIWQAQFGPGAPAAAAAGAVPEPATWCLTVLAGLACLAAVLPRRRAALARVKVAK